MRSERKHWLCADRTVAHVLAAVTPPGYFTTGTSTTKCAANSYRAGWATGTSTASCTPCGNGLSAVDDTQVVQYSTAFPYVATNIGVTTVPQSCCEWPVKLTAACSAYDVHLSGGTHMPLAALESCTAHATPLNVCPRPMPKHHACSTVCWWPTTDPALRVRSYQAWTRPVLRDQHKQLEVSPGRGNKGSCLDEMLIA